MLLILDQWLEFSPEFWCYANQSFPEPINYFAGVENIFLTLPFLEDLKSEGVFAAMLTWFRDK